MPEKVLFETEQHSSRADVASYLRTVASKLDGGGPLTLEGGGNELTLDPPETVTFEVKAEREGPAEGPGELSVEFELEWDENGGNGGNGGDLSIS